MLLVTAAQMQQLDQRTIKEFSIPGLIFMENAGRGIFELICRHYNLESTPASKEKPDRSITIFDYHRILSKTGWKVTLFILIIFPRG